MQFRLLPLATVVLVSALSAQSALQQPATISGSVHDANGKPVEGARVSIVGLQIGSNTTSAYTNDQGAFSLDGVSQGRYEIVVQKGVIEVRERFDTEVTDLTHLSLRLPVPDRPIPQDSHTISVAEYQVPGKARKAYEKAVKAINKNNPDESDRYLTEALQIYPVYSDALTLRAIRRLDQGNAESAINDLDQAIKSDSSNSRALLVMAAAYNQQKKFDEAVRILGRAEQVAPNAWQRFYEMAKALFGKADYASALKSIEKAQTAAPSAFSAVSIAKAQILVALKNYKDAAQELQAFLKAKPQDPHATEIRAMLDQLKPFENR